MSERSNKLSWVATFISLIAVGFSALQWHDNHNQLLLAMKPSVEFMTEDDDEEMPVGISIDNAGPGPATIKSVMFFVDKKPIGDAEKVIDFLHLNNTHYVELEEGDTLGVGAKDWLLKYSKKPHSKEDQKELANFIDVLDHRLAVQVEFCPVLGSDCVRRCSTPKWCE